MKIVSRGVTKTGRFVQFDIHHPERYAPSRVRVIRFSSSTIVDRLNDDHETDYHPELALHAFLLLRDAIGNWTWRTIKND